MKVSSFLVLLAAASTVSATAETSKSKLRRTTSVQQPPAAMKQQPTVEELAKEYLNIDNLSVEVAEGVRRKLSSYDWGWDYDPKYIIELLCISLGILGEYPEDCPQPPTDLPTMRPTTPNPTTASPRSKSGKAGPTMSGSTKSDKGGSGSSAKSEKNGSTKSDKGGSGSGAKSEKNALNKIWEGYLPYNVYGPGDGCEESNIVGNGTTTKLVAADDGSLCETDIFGVVTLYTKFTVTCGSEDYPDDVFVNFYNCADDMCTNCDATTEFEGYALLEKWDPKSIMSNVGHCIGWATTAATNQTEFAIITGSENGYQKFIPPSILEDTLGYFNSFLGNTCFGDFIGYD